MTTLKKLFQKKIVWATTLCLVILPFSFVSCSHDADVSNLDTVTYASIKPIIDTNCSMCHNGSKQDSYSSYSQLMSIVKPGDSNNSDLYNVISTSWSFNRMPPSPADPLTKHQRTLIDVWILQGAKEN